MGIWKFIRKIVGGMSRPPKPAPTAKKVAPPAVPHEFRHSGSSFGSAGYASSEDGVFISSGDAPGIPRDDHSDYGSTVSGVSSGKSPGPCSGVLSGYGGGVPPSAFPFPAGQLPPGQMLSHKAAVYYHHQLSLQEDQGIDMTQSPGRDSPGSSSGSAGSGSRHSTASLDSGRASAYHPLSSLGVGPSRCGPGTSGSGGSPRCSLSSCSIGSEGKIERLIAQGVPDQDIIHAWLQELHFEEYSPLFINAGYDLPTICRMTPEDLTAIGIKKPNHRKRLKAEIGQLNLPDNLPDYIPGSVEEWLRLLRLEEYAPALHAQGYRTVEDVTQLTWEDLEDIGIVKLGHQKKVILAIKRVKDIRAGKRFHAPPPASLDVGQGQDHILITSPLIHAPPPSHQQGVVDTDITDSSTAPVPPVHTTFRAFHQPWEVDQTRQMTASCYPALHHTHQQIYYQPIYCTDIVPIKIRGGRGKSLESLEDPNERSTHHTFSSENTQTFYYQPAAGGWRPRSYDDGDITPTNEVAALIYEGGGGTLPRPRGLVRPRPIAKIPPAKCRETTAIFHDYDHCHQQQKCFTGTQYKSLPRDFLEKYHQFGINTSPLKKMPPSPPKRQSSNTTLAENTNEQTTCVEIHVQSSPLPLPAYPSSDSLSISLESGGDLPLPPPPAPATPPGSAPHRLLPSKSWGGSGEEQELIAALAMQHRNGSDASFKSSSSTESDSLPFANENAGTIKTRAGSVVQRPPSRSGLPPHSSPSPLTFTSHSASPSPLSLPQHSNPNNTSSTSVQSSPLNVARPRSQPVDVLNDIGNMLANLTDELDAMLEEEKRQGLTDVQ
ncbi:caskin-2 isoform X2 [Chrysoperla carnea]|uniref:caskin-2 isoform X2 n=2 Tax=Chrysoperla carnea TaxID=189513 RepID=UPI001D0859FD|nr:caskin-2 isoform X2 [Chrysoperla carnea]